ncbi:MAG: alpha/beta hydrolase fold domain-containing protein [Bacteroidales bacterium]
MKTSVALLFTAVLSVFSLHSTEYHLQEGFASSSPSGWVRQCSSTTTINHTGLSFSGTYAIKFDPAGSGRYNKNLITPQVIGADTLSFYVSKNANATYMTLYVGKVVGADTTILQSYNAFNFPNKTASPGFAKISLPIRDSLSTFKIIFYATLSTDPQYVNAGWFVVDDIELSKYASHSPIVPPTSVAKISTNFADGSWGTIASTALATGNYPSSTINGFNLTKAYLYTGSMTCPTGETHTNRIAVDRNTQAGSVELPTLTTVGEVEIHALTGTTGMSFRLEEFANSAWQTIGTYTTIKSSDSVYYIPLARNTETKLRIANNSGSGLYIYKIATRTLQETIDLTLKSSSPSENGICFANLQKSATLTFNKNIQKMSGTILLDGVEIPLSSCSVSDNTAIIPATLTTTTSSNKNHTLTVSAGAFAEVLNPTNLSKAIVVNFQTIKSVAYPANYNGLLDVVYKNVNSTNCRMDIYYPTDAATPVPVVINMHGGGWVGGYKEEQGGFSTYFDRGFAVANVEYRMRNEILAPAAVEDVRGAMLYLLNHAQELNIAKDKIIFQGGSAGGHLALTAGYLQNNKMYDNDCTPYPEEIKVMAVIDKYGASDLITFAPVYPGMVIWLGTHANDTAFVKSLSPIEMVNANTPPTYIIHGDADPTIPYSQSVKLQAALQAAGVKNKFTTVPGGLHGGFPDSYNTQMTNEVNTFLTEILDGMTTVVKSMNVEQNSTSVIQIGNQLVIKNEGFISVKVFDNLGTLILKTQNKTFEAPGKGLFLIQLKSTQGVSTTKVFIK